MASPTADRRLGLVGNTAIKAPVLVVATSNITLSGEQTIDGVAVHALNAAGVPDRVLVAGNTDATQNGIYDVSTAAWTRSIDTNGTYDLRQGTFVNVAQGTTYQKTGWTLTTADPITIGTTALSWSVNTSSTVTANIANINAVAGDLTNINSVAGDLTNVNAVAGDLTNVNSVAGDLTNVNSVAADLTNIDTTVANLTTINLAITASATAGVYPNTAAANVPQGLTQASVGAITAGSGGTNGTFALAWSSGNFLVNPTGTFTVAGGVLTAVTITGPGLYIGGAPSVPTPSFAASAGLGGGAAVALTIQFLVTSGNGYWAASSDGSQLDRYKNVSGVATADSTVPSIATATLFQTLNGVSPVWGVNDDRGNTAIEVATNGTTTVSNIVPLQTNGLDLRYSARPASLGNFDAELMVFIGDGQSNMGGQNPGVTTVVEYDNIGFACQANAPVAYSDLTVANCSSGGVAEPLIFGALSYIKKLLQQENGLSPTDVAFQLLAADNSQGSTAINAHQKGSQYYGYGTSQATAAVTLAATQQRSVAHGGVFWNQGEADQGSTTAIYQAALIQLATDYNTDLKAITGQTKNTTVITAQTTSSTTRVVPLAQLGAANASALVKLCTPMYQFDYNADGIHVVLLHDRWLGAYYGLAWKRIWVDLLTWKPTQPVSSTRSGKIAYITYDCMVQPLVLDTTGVPAQTNSGFTMVDSGGSAVTISSVTVCAPNKIKVVTATNMGAGAKLRYGFGVATGKGAYGGAAGNLRDSQGNCVPDMDGHLMHNWCAVHEFTIA